MYKNHCYDDEGLYKLIFDENSINNIHKKNIKNLYNKRYFSYHQFIKKYR